MVHALTEPQRKLLERAVATEDGFASCWTSADVRVGKRLAAMGLGESCAPYFEINDAGRAALRQETVT